MSADFDHGVEVWSSASWRAMAVAWMDAQLAAAGIERTGAVEQPHLRPWATALKAPTSRGPVWLKAAGPGTAFEVGLYELLHEVAPDRVLTPLAADVVRGWIVLPDGGAPLGDRLSGAELADAMATVLPQYGRLQRDLAPHAGRLLDLGLTDMRPAIMPRRFDEALELVAGYVARRDDPAERATLRRVAALGETVAAWCERLAALPVPPSVDHNDLHPWNIFVTGAGQARFYDWGDSVVAHPFSSVLVALGFVAPCGRWARTRSTRIGRARRFRASSRSCTTPTWAALEPGLGGARSTFTPRRPPERGAPAATTARSTP